MIKNVSKMLFAFVLMLTGLLIVPGGNHQVYAAHLEDCDLDGFDDATGVPVPWPGYDETKGDTPDGPGGSKTSGSTSGSTTTNNNSTGTTGTTNSSADDTTSSTINNTTSTSSSNAADSTAGSTTNNTTNNTKSNTKSNTKTSTSSSTTSSTTNSTKNSTANTTSSDAASDKVNSTISEKSNSKPGEKGSNAISKNSGSETTETTSNAPIDKPSTATDGNTSSEATGNEEDATSGDTGNGEAEVTSSEGGIIQGDSEVTAESAEPVVAEFTDLSEGFIDSIINTKGTLDITEATGSLFHAGGTIIITGSGFEGNIDSLEIEIHSEPQRLGVVASNEDGSFDIQVNLPESLEPGIHQIVVLYQGNEIVRQQIEIGSKAADSFLQALSVGFTSDNKGLIPGLAILGGLFVLGLVVLVINELIRSRRAKKQVLVQ
jgi:hypothetical protein